MFRNLPAHLFAYSGIFGATCYQSFFAGIASYKALPIEMFAKLQHRIFPGYFTIQAAFSFALLITAPFDLQRSGLGSLLTTLIGSLFNLLVIIPITSRLTHAREAQMEKEGKGYRDPTASDEMKAINKQFSKVHGYSMLVNLAVIIAIFYYGYYFSKKLRIATQD